MEEHNYTVYMHKNKINGKVYIGITKQKPKYRWHNGEGYNHQVFKRAIDKYGCAKSFIEQLKNMVGIILNI